MVTELIQKYIWLYDKVLSAGDKGISLKEITADYEWRWGAGLTRRTFINYKEAVQEIFGVTIECDRAENRYYVKFGSDAVDKEQTKSWLINTFTLNNLLSLRDQQLSGRVSVENVPSGHRWLSVLMAAMKDSRKLKITYRQYRRTEPEEREVEPYGLKEDEKRWYLIAKRNEGTGSVFRVYSLDRIMSVEVLDGDFTVPADFDIDSLFRNCYGAFLSDGGQSVEKVVFRASSWQAKYLRDLPLHESQTEFVPDGSGHDDSGTVYFSMRVVPNAALVNDFCKMGAEVEVLEPESLRNAVVQRLSEALAQYRDDKS